jgi:hypothetical protein
MSTRTRPAPIVAELGRPETPEETAARQAESSRLYRARKTINNLWFSIIACLGILIVIVIIVPRNDSPRQYDVDYTSIAQGAQSSMPVPLAAPTLPAGWHSNAAELRSQDKIDYWYVGLLTPGGQYIGLTQAVNANDTWIANQLARTGATGNERIGGVDWTIYDNTRSTRTDLGNAQYAMETQAGPTTFLLIGTANHDEFSTLAAAIAPTVSAQ